MRLVVLRHIGGGNEDGRLVHRAQFGYRAGAAARHDGVRRRISEVHPGDEIVVLHARGGMLLHEFIDAFLIIPSALPDHFEVLAARASGFDPALHGPVQRAAAQAAAHDEEMLLLRVQVIVVHRFGLHGGRGRGGDFLADGVAAHHDLVGREETLHPFVRDADLLHPFPQHLVRQAGEAVLLLDEGGNLHPGRGEEQGSAGIAAYADGDVRPELADEFLRHRHAPEHPERHLDIVDDVLQVQLALHAHDRETDDPVAGRRDFFHLHLAGGPDEEDLRFRIQFLQFVRNRDGREDVPSRAAAADDGS